MYRVRFIILWDLLKKEIDHLTNILEVYIDFAAPQYPPPVLMHMASDGETECEISIPFFFSDSSRRQGHLLHTTVLRRLLPGAASQPPPPLTQTGCQPTLGLYVDSEHRLLHIWPP